MKTKANGSKYQVSSLITTIKNSINRKYLATLGIFIIALYFRLKGLNTRDVWYDEVLTILQANRGIVGILKDVPTPVHYIFVYVFSFIGKSTLILGAPSVIFGILSIIVVRRIGELVYNEKVGLLAAFLLAISPMHIEFSQQILFFSYYTFFSILSLFYLIKFIISYDTSKISWVDLILCIFFGWINILTQMVGMVVAAQELIFLSIYITFTRKNQLKDIFRKKFFLVLISITILGLLTYFIGNGGYGQFFKNEIKIDFNKPITVGYSLTSQIHSTVLSFNKDFFKAMFSWFGIGGGYRLYIYVFLFIIGLQFLFSNGKAKFGFLIVSWIFSPFIFLYFVRLNHWFEEKYFIFIIPIYLLVVAIGILRITSLIFARIKSQKWIGNSSSKLKLISVLIDTLVVVFFFSLAVFPISNRTTFGFKFKGHTVYNWREAYTFLENNLEEGDHVWLPKNGTLFLDYYFGPDKEKFISDELSVIRMTQEEYIDLVSKNNRNYFISIPDFHDLFLSNAASARFITNVGGFNIYEIKFLRQNPIVIKADSDTVWEYYDDFRGAGYLSSSSNRKNMTTTYSESTNVPIHEGFNTLSPISFEDSSISYQFIIPRSDKNIYFQPLFSIDEGVAFEVQFVGSSTGYNKIYEQNSDRFKFFSPTIKLPKSTPGVPISLKLVFRYKNGAKHLVGGAQIKSIWLTNDVSGGINIGDYGVSLSNNLKKEFVYDSEFEVVKKNKWIRHTTTREGWLQTNEGFLIKGYGNNNDQMPLTYKFQFANKIGQTEIKLKAFANYTNPIAIEYSEDGISWKKLGIINDNIQKIYSFNLGELSLNSIFIRFFTKLDGPSSQIRNINIIFREK